MPDGTPYAASDPHLLALGARGRGRTASCGRTSVYGRRPLDQAGRDEYVAQTAVVARRLGVVDPPTTEAELAEALAAYRPELRGTPRPARRSRFLLCSRRCRWPPGRRTACSWPPRSG